ncbi:hypothetical protein HNQ69_001587 [Bartonella callosciuri]|uniref:Deoxyuridine 5'-triphosphate nucleotidohydrolase n=1 Tax=Bartonella callosciuri TaxID=686223 RepID=A0A840NWX3_9HYPH|nr:hypothetical protein [Bartonella callosciuri]
MRIAQTIIAPVLQVNLCVLEPDQTESTKSDMGSRGTGGFGSTGQTEAEINRKALSLEEYYSIGETVPTTELLVFTTLLITPAPIFPVTFTPAASIGSPAP